MMQLVPGEIVHIAVFGRSDGAIGATTVTGGRRPYAVSWHCSAGATSIADGDLDAHRGLSAGTYRITVVDYDGAIAYVDYVVTQPDELVITPGIIEQTLQEKKHIATITETRVAGGVPPYTVSWTSQKVHNKTIESDTTLDAKSGLESDRYLVTVSDTAGAVASHLYIVPEHRRMYRNGNNGFSPKRR
jgi:hypothetical protein